MTTRYTSPLANAPGLAPFVEVLQSPEGRRSLSEAIDRALDDIASGKVRITRANPPLIQTGRLRGFGG